MQQGIVLIVTLAPLLLVALAKRWTVSRKFPCLVSLNPMWVICHHVHRLHLRLSLPLPVPSSSSCLCVPPMFPNAAAEFCACAEGPGQRKLTGRRWAKKKTIWSYLLLHSILYFHDLVALSRTGHSPAPSPPTSPSQILVLQACSCCLPLPEPAQCTVLDLHGGNLKINAQYNYKHTQTR